MWEISNGLNLLLKRGDAITVDVMVKEVKLSDTQVTFVGVDDNPIFGLAFEYHLYMPEVFSRGGAVNICVGKEDSMKDLTHEPVKCLGGVLQPKRHSYKLE